MERDKQYWEEVRDMWQQSVEQDKGNLEMKSKAKREYLSALQGQIAEKRQSKVNHQSELKDESVLQETDRKTHQSRTQQLREKKLQQLRYLLYRVSQQVLAGSIGLNNHNGSLWVWLGIPKGSIPY